MKIYKNWGFLVSIGMAVWEIWLAYTSTSDRDMIIRLFAATFFLISGYGMRIFDAVASLNTIKEESK
jgi:hypothetical protein